MLGKMLDALLALTYPQVCQVCENSVENYADGVSCRDCWSKTHLFSDAEVLCAKCGAFLRYDAANVETFCHRCDEHFYDSARAAGIYEHALAATILHLKKEPFVATRARQKFLSRFQTSDFQDATLIVPVPLSKKRFLERGFNQAVVLSEILARKTRIKFDGKSLARRIHTTMHRAGMDARARAASVENAFEVLRPNLIRDERILLVDDVFTSGATVSACAKILKESDAERVYVFTLARTL